MCGECLASLGAGLLFRRGNRTGPTEWAECELEHAFDAQRGLLYVGNTHEQSRASVSSLGGVVALCVWLKFLELFIESLMFVYIV